ncbi:uncharacterized protein SPPG_04959 [Spizellomyces punctatus DAOM BR117]|uniref:PHD-type domain-containing protein n=1 Tax=Spizellomyces punctatus (strain DAOM BR117) TaxID=645134 RepID=A0A0L0HDP8_SPIPD|nr:uncharacterized protein SPPG_04959 [Spizellomyces punctatus DAOM BR117]KNC99570.1 hypothetical protein SPPG_04959 [Spizellomyces punctatus DAOM BR117]|eukprot:XP_016607610.1 hypothetical protein SPPG_04959 [Spizellomyces punctatus DAOM BR117]
MPTKSRPSICEMARRYVCRRNGQSPLQAFERFCYPLALSVCRHAGLRFRTLHVKLPVTGVTGLCNVLCMPANSNTCSARICSILGNDAPSTRSARMSVFQTLPRSKENPNNHSRRMLRGMGQKRTAGCCCVVQEDRDPFDTQIPCTSCCQFFASCLPSFFSQDLVKKKKKVSRKSIKGRKSSSANERDDDFLEPVILPPIINSRKLALPANCPAFHIDAIVEVRDGAKTWWPGRVVTVQSGKVCVHYDGWGDQYDEWIDCESQRIRLATQMPADQCSERISQENEHGQTGEAGIGPDAVILVGRSVREKRKKSAAYTNQKNAKRKKANSRTNVTVVNPITSKSTESATPARPQGFNAQQPRSSSTSPVDNFGIFRAAANREAREAYISRRALANDATADDMKRLYGKGARVEVCCAGGERYMATVIKTRSWQVLVQYDGWDEAWNEWIDMNSSKMKLVEAASGENNSSEDGNSSAGECSSEEDDEQKWKIFCNRCEKRIRQYRYFCTYCEVPSEGFEYESFDLCLACFQQDFPLDHPHPIQSFAVEPLLDTDDPTRRKFKDGELVSTFVLDEFDTSYIAMGTNQSQIDAETVVTAIPMVPRCAFCHSERTDIVGPFIGPHPFRNTRISGRRMPLPSSEKKNSGKNRRVPIFWAHDACARFSPEVYFMKDSGKWHNVLKALARGRGVKCAACKERGATIGCFDVRCTRSYHVGCTRKPLSQFEEGVIFWCPRHESLVNKADNYKDVYNCDVCSNSLGLSDNDEQWHTCDECAQNHFNTFDLCKECFEGRFPETHDHGKDRFITTCMSQRKEIREMEQQLARELVAANASRKSLGQRRKKKLERASGIRCAYCWIDSSSRWRKGYNGIPMCEDCFQMASSAFASSKAPELCATPEAIPSPSPSESLSQSPVNAPTPVPVRIEADSPAPVLDPTSMERVYRTEIEAYSHEYYLTRGVVGKASGADEIGAAEVNKSSEFGILQSYAPTDDQLFTMGFDTSFYDIPGRAPRWATHSGGDYHGTWLPQIVRMSLLRYTSEGERVLSNFSGRGTDAIECFLLKRRCCSVDINPASVALSQRNVSFSVPPELGLTAAYRPVIVLADSRELIGSLFEDESYDHILSHPPYKDCVSYSAHIEGDLSHFPDMEDFQKEMEKIVAETWRLLKPNRRCTLGIGDNRRECFYQPVSFQTIRTYINDGFELEELIVKRQRYCQMAPLGTYLCTQYNFLMFTHEFIAILRKVDDRQHSGLFSYLKVDDDHDFHVNPTRILRVIPAAPIDRTSIVMGTVWTFRVTQKHSLARLAMSKLIERFGTDSAYWEEVSISEFRNKVIRAAVYDDLCAERDPPEEEDEEEENGTEVTEYERRRREQLSKNTRELLSMGLISELSPEGEDDAKHLETLLAMPPVQTIQHEGCPTMHPPSSPVIIFVPHINAPSTAILPHAWINEYRKFVIDCARDAAARLTDGGYFIIGVKDARIFLPPKTDPSSENEQPCGIQTKYVPLGLLVSEDLSRYFEGSEMRLKDFVVAVPEGYSRDKGIEFEEMKARIDEDEQEWKSEQEKEANGQSNVRRLLPIVQAYYFIYAKQAGNRKLSEPSS